MAQINLKQCSVSPNYYCFPPADFSLPLSNANMKNTTSMEETDASSQGSAVGFSSARENPFHGSNDFPLGFSAMIRSSPQLVPITGQGSSSTATNMAKAFRIDGKSSFEGIKTEGDASDELLNLFMDGFNSVADDKEKCTKINGVDTSNSDKARFDRSAVESIAPQPHHYRSISMDGSIGNFHFDDSSARIHPSLSQFPRSNSLSDNLAKINLDFGSGEFNDFELKKIMADERLAEIVTSDPKRVKRILANRQSAARSKERKLRYISELEHKVRTLQTEATTLSAQITTLQKDNTDLAKQNNELKLHIQAMQQQAHLREALHDTLTAEVQHLKCMNAECKDSRGKLSSSPTKRNVFTVQGQQLNHRR